LEDIMENTAAYRTAVRHVKRKTGFYSHLAVYLAVNGGLMLLHLLATPARTWAIGPLFGWGIALLLHGLSVFLNKPGAAWKQRMIENELKKK
jgi:hypothetical protein